LVDKYGGVGAATHAVYRIVDQTGKEIKAVSLVSELPEKAEIWHGVGVTKNGFAVRFAAGGRTTIRLFDNAGNPTSTNIDLATLADDAAAAGGGRGDGSGFHGNGNDAYVAVTSGTTADGLKGVSLTVIGSDAKLRYNRNAAEGYELLGADRVDAAIHSDGRVFVVFDDASATTNGVRTVLGRLFDPAGKPLGGAFYVSEKEGAGVTADSRRARVAWRDNTAAVVWESKSSSAAPLPVVAGRIFTIAGAAGPLKFTTVTPTATGLTLEWSGGTSPYLVEMKNSLSDAAWSKVTTTPNLKVDVSRSGKSGFFRVSDRATP
jgi:hypothetical protein